MRSAVGYSEKGISRSFQLCVCQWLETLTSQPSSSFFFLVSFSQWKGKNQTPRWLDEWSIVLFTTWPTQQPTHTRLLYDNRDTQKREKPSREREKKNETRRRFFTLTSTRRRINIDSASIRASTRRLCHTNISQTRQIQGFIYQMLLYSNAIPIYFSI